MYEDDANTDKLYKITDSHICENFLWRALMKVLELAMVQNLVAA